MQKGVIDMSLKRFVLIVVVAAATLFVLILLLGWLQSKEDYQYESTEISASVVRIVGEPNVRREPVLHNGEDGNALGAVRESGFTLVISSGKIKEADVDSNNGAYYGFRVEDILGQTEGEKWFPSRIKKDKDGWVWIHTDYVQILF